MDPVELHNFLVDLRSVLSDSLPSLRDRFAMAALHALVGHIPSEGVARAAYEHADEMLKAREQKWERS